MEMYIESVELVPNPVVTNGTLKIEVYIYGLYPEENLYPTENLYPGSNLHTLYPSESSIPAEDLYPTEGGIET